MAFHPITVNKGPEAEPHIYAEDDASIFQCMFGEDGILDIGSKLELSIQSNNLVRMSDGVLCVGGHIGRIKHADYVDLTIDNGETGYNRNDLIIGSFSNTGEHTIDTFDPQVVKGTPATGDAVDPTLTEGSLYEGEHLRQTAVARVRLKGLNIVGVDMLLPVIPSIPSLKALLDELNGKMELSEYNVDNLNIYEENGIVHVNGMVAINAATGNIQLPYANAGIKDVHAPVIGVFQDMSIAGYGYLNLGRNTNAAYIGMNTAVTYAIMAFSYKGQ